MQQAQLIRNTELNVLVCQFLDTQSLCSIAPSVWHQDITDYCEIDQILRPVFLNTAIIVCLFMPRFADLINSNIPLAVLACFTVLQNSGLGYMAGNGRSAENVWVQEQRLCS